MRKQGDVLSQEEVEKIGEVTDGYSGADMTNLCREAGKKKYVNKFISLYYFKLY